ncbi:MAG: phage holin family protein [Prevotella sp.]|uniref:Phage holin family protein n=1 Tax=Segatella cerevisiae TaxID=2053716 RepID=A0ABT1BYW0_9BACT|nr:phage holin family protein [Segatella cerevisiae]MCH3995849.1 phage holin family protein [Prevotella sp.]MCI1245829.1 phage holin family protein [Prevotella sp.]MCO6026005.1 phage holin family protein [Segatella cerevisiae]
MFSNDKNIETIGQLIEALKHDIGLRAEYMKFDVIDKVVRILTTMWVTLLISGILILLLISLSLAAGFAIASAIGSTPLAFCIIAGIYLLLLLLVIIFRHRWIERPLVRFLASLLLQ